MLDVWRQGVRETRPSGTLSTLFSLQDEALTLQTDQAQLQGVVGKTSFPQELLEIPGFSILEYCQDLPVKRVHTGTERQKKNKNHFLPI